MSPLYKITKLEHTSQLKLMNDPKSNKVNDVSIKKTKPGTLYDNLLSLP